MKKLIAANDNYGGFYTYVWRNASRVPFYVGKGKGNRAYDLYDRSGDFLAIHAEGGCTVEIVDWFIHESQAHAHEVELIEFYGRREFGGLLVNKTDGGEGASGHVKSPETIEKWRAKNVGRTRSDEVRARMSEAKKGHVVSEEARAKLSAVNKKRFEDPEERERQRRISLNMSAESRAKLSAAGKLRMSDPLVRIRLSEIATGKQHTQETRAKISAARAGVPKSEETRASMRAAQRMKPPRGLYKGVSVAGNKWRAIIYVDGRTQSIGTFTTPEAAARAYDQAAIAAWGLGNCYINMPIAANDNGQLSLFGT
ncbi:NUMOD3 domain-containing DNA-binding protein [Rhizobium leucaenae]|uniref:NUMOD3 domain-containing DNA-binding protein n=1 Tax=Rhizobium leucaenae TaxID=29450 RepID=UPI0007EE595F|nr:NUMOD3 domain-containing DNA-binding protein [Rhizobium leucaenae]